MQRPARGQKIDYSDKPIITQSPGVGPFELRFHDTYFCNSLCVLIAVNTHLGGSVFTEKEAIMQWWTTARLKMQATLRKA